MKVALTLCLLLASTTSIASNSVISPKNQSDDVRKLSLQDALEIGLANQAAITQAHGVITQAEAQKLAAISNFIPSLSIGNQLEFYKPIDRSGNTFIAGTLVPAAQGFYYNAITANFNFNLFSGGKDVALYDASLAAIDSANATLQETINATFVSILKDYAALSADEESIAAQRKIVSLDQESSRLTNIRYQHGIDSKISWISAKQAVLQAQMQLYQALQQSASDQKRLLRAMGIKQTVLAISVRQGIPSPPYDGGRSSQMIHPIHDPAMEAARAQISEARQQLRAARAGFWPTLSLVAQYNWLGQNSDDTLNAIAATKGSNYAVGLEFNIPLLPAMNVVAAVQSAQAGVVNALGNYDNALTTVESRIAYAKKMYHNASMTEQIAKRASNLATENVTLTIKRYIARQGNRIDVNKERSLSAQSVVAEQKAKINKRLAQWELFRALHPKQFAHRLLVSCRNK